MGITFSGMASTTKTFFVTCFLMTCINNAAAECNTSLIKLKFDEVGLCSPNGSVGIWHCQSCPPGLGHSVECGQFYDEGTKLGCVRCPAGTYSNTYDTSQCKKCKKCQKNEIKRGQCTSLKDNITCTCKPGLYRDQHARDCKHCSWCCGDKSNEYMPECNVPQVPLGQRCSFQIVKRCAPTTTSSPTTGATSPTNFSTTGTLSSSLIPATKIEKTIMTKKVETKMSSNKHPTSGISNDKVTSKDPPNEGKNGSGDTEWTKILLWLAIVCIIGFLLFLLVMCYYKKRKESRSSGLHGNQAMQHLCSCHSRSCNESGCEECVYIDMNAATVVYHFGSQGPSEIHPSQANEIRLPTTRLSDEQLSFICETLGEKIEDLNPDIIQAMCEMLNVQVTHNGKDYRNLDSFCKLNYYQRKNLEGKQNPMEDIIDIMVSHSMTLKSFLDELYKISRGDVVEKLYEIGNEQGG